MCKSAQNSSKNFNTPLVCTRNASRNDSRGDALSIHVAKMVDCGSRNWLSISWDCFSEVDDFSEDDSDRAIKRGTVAGKRKWSNIVRVNKVFEWAQR
jgi:hypothetical protein